MEIIRFQSLSEMNEFFGFIPGWVGETDLCTYEDFTDANDRKLRDAEVLTTLAKNIDGNCLEIGTSFGRGAYKLATNIIERNHVVFTLNSLPGKTGGTATTHELTKNQIGSFLVERNIHNFYQYYCDSKIWVPPTEVKQIALAFVDGCHDEEYVLADSRKVYALLERNGFIVWHDFNPELEHDPRAGWITSCMRGVRRFCEEASITKVYHLKHSWIGFAWKGDRPIA